MPSKRSPAFILPVLAALMLASCGGGSGGDEDGDPTAIADAGNDNETPPAVDTPYEPIPGDFTDVYSEAPAGPTGLLKDNLAGIWLVTTVSTTNYVIPYITKHSISRSIKRIHALISGSESNPIVPGMQVAPVSCGIGSIAISPEADATTAIFVENIDVPVPPALNIVSDTRMERRNADDYVVWQKIDVPTDENDDPIIGTIDYTAAGVKTFSGTTTIKCLTLAAEQTAAGADASNAPLLLASLSFRSETGGTATTGPFLLFNLVFAAEPATPSSQDMLYVSTFNLTPGEGMYEQRFSPNLDDVEFTGEAHMLDAISVSAANSEENISITWQLNH